MVADTPILPAWTPDLGGDCHVGFEGPGGGLGGPGLAHEGGVAGAEGAADEAGAWGRDAEALADWALRWLVNRNDGSGGFRPDEEHPGRLRQTTSKRPLTLERLVGHFRARDATAIVGLHTTVRVKPARGKGRMPSVSRWIAVDIDRHDESVDPEATLRAALAWHARLEALGFTPLLLDSNGNGGYHLYAIFDAPVPTPLAYAFARWLVRDWRELGLAAKPESFPKQRELSREKPWGNWLRVPGRHHKRDCYSRVWDGASWLRGEAAVRAILGTGGSPEALIPAHVVAVVEAEEEDRREKANARRRRARRKSKATAGAKPARKPAKARDPRRKGSVAGAGAAEAGRPKTAKVPVRKPDTPGRRSGDPGTLAAGVMKRYPLTAPGQRHLQMGRAVASLMRAGHGDAAIFDALMIWFDRHQAEGLTLTDRGEMEAELAASIRHTRSRPAFEPTGDGPEGHLAQCAGIRLEDWQSELLLPGPIGSGNGRAASGKGTGGEAADTPICTEVTGNGFHRTRLCESRQDSGYVEAMLVLVMHEREQHPGGHPRFTHGQLNDVLVRRGGTSLKAAQIERLKRKYITRPGRKASRFELLREVDKGKKGEGGRPGTPSEYEVTGLLHLLPEGFTLGQTLPAPPSPSDPSPRQSTGPLPAPRPAPPAAPAREGPSRALGGASASPVDVRPPEAADAPHAVPGPLPEAAPSSHVSRPIRIPVPHRERIPA